jgi:hypothetical protein
VTELQWELRHAKESFHAASVSLDCDQATMVTQHGKPMFTKVQIKLKKDFLGYCSSSCNRAILVTLYHSLKYVILGLTIQTVNRPRHKVKYDTHWDKYASSKGNLVICEAYFVLHVSNMTHNFFGTRCAKYASSEVSRG